EYSVMGEKSGTHFAHRWFLGSDKTGNHEQVQSIVDHFLKNNNDDYSVQRSALLNDVSVEFLPSHLFYDWLASKGKMNGQAKSRG
ncbi:MAG: GH3 auxin-responsive promoter family protein, partial [Saprospiraceae bacterium]